MIVNNIVNRARSITGAISLLAKASTSNATVRRPVGKRPMAGARRP